MSFEERRQKRSHDPLVALHYQLTTARADGLAETLVIADQSGVMMAGAGAWAACEELAAYAPLLLQTADASEPTRFASLRNEVDVRAVNVDGHEVLLCARSQRKTATLGPALERAAAGIQRILAA